MSSGRQITSATGRKLYHAWARPPLGIEALIERWHALPAVDPDRLRADVDAVLDPTL